MELQSLKVSTRTLSGKGGARQTRRNGNVPGVLYGLSADPVRLQVDAREFETLLQGDQGEHAMLQLEFEDRPELNGPAMIKEVQHHPVRDNAVHTDLQRIDLSKRIHTVVPIRLEGHSRGVIEGGVIDHQTREVEVSCLPMEVPDAFPISIEEMDIGDSIHVRDLVIPDNIELLTSGDRALAAVHAPRVIVEEVVAEEEEALLAEGEEAEGEAAEGEAPAEGGEGGDEETSKGKRTPGGK